MSRKRGGATPPQPWEPFTERLMSDEGVRALAAEGWPPGTYRVYRNNRFQVYVRGHTVAADAHAFAGERVLHLSIKRIDRGVVRDWRHLQRIKNELVGPEVEAVELFPAESRLLDEANQYHLWCFIDSDFRFLGAQQRVVGDSADAAAIGARQRPLDAHEQGDSNGH